MNPWLAFVIGAWVGAPVGMFTLALLNVDKWSETGPRVG